MLMVDALVYRLCEGGEARRPIFRIRWCRGRRQRCLVGQAVDEGRNGRGGEEVGSGRGLGKFDVADWWGGDARRKI